MKMNLKKSLLVTLLAILAAMMCLCSCDTVKKAVGDAASSVIESAKGEISSAIDEGMAELGEGRKEIDEGLGEVSSALTSISDEIKEEISGAMSDISEEVGRVSGEAASAVSSAVSEVSEEIVEQISSVSGEVSQEISEAVGQAAPETTKAAKWYTFRNKERYDEHYKKHGAEFGNITKQEYLQLANDLINDTSDRILHKYSSDGDYMYFNQDNNYFLVLSQDEYIRTFFIPSAGINYWNRQ